jgi:condensin complex subunit 2
LVKDFNAITLKKFDLEFSVDPLFKKTSADFDEGGARGLLLNHLGTHEGLKIVFDASDVTPYHGDVTDEQAIDDESNVDEAPKTEEDRMEIKEDVDMMEHQSEHEHLDKEVESSDVIADTAKALDISRLKAKFSAGLQNIWQRDICPSLLNFEFSSESLDIPLFQTAVTDRDPLAIDDDTDDLEDDFFDQDLENADLVFGIDDDLDDEEEDADALRPRQASVPKQDNEEEEDYSIIPNFSEADFLASMANNTNELFSYFDNAINKNWAGPQHWKLLRPAKKTIEKTAPATQTRKEKETVVIDFLNGEDVDLNGLFAPATTSISMPRTHDRAEEQNMLPDDLHYSARRLLSLFIKPTLMVGGFLDLKFC